MCVLFTVQPGEHGPAVTALGWLLYSTFEGCPRHCVLRRVKTLVMTETAEQSFVRSERFWVAVAKRLGHAVRQNALRVGNRGDDAGHNVIRQLEDRFRAIRAIVGFCPEARARAGIYQLGCDTGLRARLAQASFHR